MNKVVLAAMLLGLLITSSVFFLRGNSGKEFFYGTQTYTNNLPKLVFIPISLGLVSILLVAWLFNNDWILLLFVLSPTFTGEFTSLTYQAASFSALLIAGLFFKNKKKILSYGFLFLSFIFFLKEASFNFSAFDIISELGNPIGVSFFLLVLGVYGMTSFEWKDKKILFTLVILGSLAFLFNNLNIHLHLFMSFFAGLTLEKLFNKDWVLKEIKVWFFLIIFSAILFSTISHVFYLSDMPPSQSFNLYLSEFAEEDVVLTTSDMGVWLEYYGAAKSVKNNTVYESSFNELKQFLEKEKISHIVLPTYFIKQNEKLTFLLEENIYLNKKVSHKEIHIWEVNWNKKK